ncbi:MAG: hydrogenase expression/formation protein HypE [Planctomycetota bacterium]|nr:hydrogenase expression/formation protein HypE [Planctomycetota bacterium]
MNDEIILLADGGGGERMMGLVRREILSRFAPGGRGELARLGDAARIELAGTIIAFTTDSYVVRPLEFPGGDIGRLAVAGTVNDLACLGARPVALSLALILEEGLPLATLRRVLDSAARTASEAHVAVVCGDTKVVERGGADGLFINTSGIGAIAAGRRLGAEAIRPGDRVLLSGTMGDHGIAVMSRREGLEFESAVASDVAPLWPLAEAVLAASPNLRALKDPTRGGLAAAVNELAESAGVGMRIEESAIPVRPAVEGACEALGLDVLSVANEGKFVAVVPPDEAEAVLQAMRGHALGCDAALVGEVTDAPARGPRVTLRTAIGGERILEMPYGEDLPRIC